MTYRIFYVTIEKRKFYVSDSKQIELTVWSLVNTDVYYLNDKENLVFKIDHNSGYDYMYGDIYVFQKFKLALQYG